MSKLMLSILGGVAEFERAIIREPQREGIAVAKGINPWIGARPIAEVTPPGLLAVIQRIEKRGALETAHRALGNCSQVFRYAVATGRCKSDPSHDLRGALPPETVVPMHLDPISLIDARPRRLPLAYRRAPYAEVLRLSHQRGFVLR